MISENERAVYDNGEERNCYEEFVEDITEKKLTEDELQISRKQFRNLSAHLQLVIEQERRYISREIHDELGQMLSVLRMDLIWIKDKISPNITLLVQKVESMLQVVDTASDAVLRIATELRPRLLDDLGLIAAIEWQIVEFQERTGIQCKLTVDSGDLLLDQQTSTAIYRILQETLTNIMRHSNAKQVGVHLRELDEIIELKVEDNGKGITKEKIFNEKSIGLIGMKERARLLCGEVDIIGIPGKGTTVTVQVPHKKGKGFS